MLILRVDAHWELKALQFDLGVEVFEVAACTDIKNAVLGLFFVLSRGGCPEQTCYCRFCECLTANAPRQIRYSLHT